MKKLIIALAVLTMGFCAQAAALGWGSYAYLNDGAADEDWFTGGQAYLILVTDKANFAVANDLSITGGNIIQNDAYDVGSVGTFIDGSAFGAEDGSTYYFAVLATDSGNGAAVPATGLYGIDNNGGAFYSITWNKDTGASFEPNELGASVTMSVGGGSVDSGPGPSGIPEPTSGLLLLVGGALLALRRKQK